jgi:hypothetical protein
MELNLHLKWPRAVQRTGTYNMNLNGVSCNANWLHKWTRAMCLTDAESECLTNPAGNGYRGTMATTATGLLATVTVAPWQRQPPVCNVFSGLTFRTRLCRRPSTSYTSEALATFVEEWCHPTGRRRPASLSSATDSKLNNLVLCHSVVCNNKFTWTSIPVTIINKILKKVTETRKNL